MAKQDLVRSVNSVVPPEPNGSGELSRRERLTRIQEVLAQKGQATVNDLSRMFGVSETTIRWDLRELENRGLLKRVRGGVVGSATAVNGILFHDRMNLHLTEKVKIGAVAARLIKDNSTVFIASGTTTLQVARHIGPMRQLVLVTNSLPIMHELGPQTGIAVTLVGGLHSFSSSATAGPLAVENLKQFHGDMLFIGVDGVTVAEGLTGNDTLEAEVLRTMIERVDEVVLVVDSSKIGRVAFMRIAPLQAVQKLVTDSGIVARDIAALEKAGIEVIVA